MTNCNLIRDLLPFYEDRAVSEESRKIMHEHIKNCPECRKYYEQIRRIPHSLQNYEARGGYHYSEIAKSLRRNTLISYAAGAGMVTLSAICVAKAVYGCRDK